MNRRKFLRTSSATTLLSTVAGSVSISKALANPNDRISIGIIGFGKQANGLIGRAFKMPQAQVSAISDVVGSRLNAGAEKADAHYGALNGDSNYKGTAKIHDFREMIARDDIDALIIATPDHWHAIPAIQGARAKKDLYCEKPISLTVEEGRAMVNAVQENKVVFQTGSMQRSEYDGKFRIAAEMVRNGAIGEIWTVRVGVGGPAVPCDLPTEEAPADTDWDFWNGPAPERGYNEILCPKGMHNHFPRWRDYTEYANGPLADIGAHHFDIAQWGLGMDDSGPVKWLPPTDPNATSGLRMIYDNGVEMIHGGLGGTTFIGSKGIISVDRSRLDFIPGNLREEFKFPENGERLENAGGRNGISHMANWISCIESREKPICHEEIGHRSASICELANIAYNVREDLTWDPKAEKFSGKGTDKANGLLSREMRGDWSLA